MVLTLGINWLVSGMATLFALTCAFMMLVILIQKPKGGGLSGAFGGAGGSAQAAFGAKTGDLLTVITIVCFVLFIGLAMGLVYAIRADVTPTGRAATSPPATAPATSGATTPDATTEAVEPETGTAGEAEAEVPAIPEETASTDAPAEAPAGEPSEPDAQP